MVILTTDGIGREISTVEGTKIIYVFVFILKNINLQLEVSIAILLTFKNGFSLKI